MLDCLAEEKTGFQKRIYSIFLCSEKSVSAQAQTQSAKISKSAPLEQHMREVRLRPSAILNVSCEEQKWTDWNARQQVCTGLTCWG